MIELDKLLQTHEIPRSHIPTIKKKRRASLAPSTTKECSSDSGTDESTDTIVPSNKAAADVATHAPNGIMNDDNLNELATDVASCTANGMVNDDDLKQPATDVTSFASSTTINEDDLNQATADIASFNKNGTINDDCLS